MCVHTRRDLSSPHSSVHFYMLLCTLARDKQAPTAVDVAHTDWTIAIHHTYKLVTCKLWGHVMCVCGGIWLCDTHVRPLCDKWLQYVMYSTYQTTAACGVELCGIPDIKLHGACGPRAAGTCLCMHIGPLPTCSSHHAFLTPNRYQVSGILM